MEKNKNQDRIGSNFMHLLEENQVHVVEEEALFSPFLTIE